MILEHSSNDLKEEMAGFVKKKRKLTRCFEILVSCDLHDDKGTPIKWTGGSRLDNMKCGECEMWTYDDGMCKCDFMNFDCRFNASLEWQAKCGDEPVNYRNGIIMRLQTSKVGKNNVVQVKYSKNAYSRFFCGGDVGGYKYNYDDSEWDFTLQK